MEELDIAIEVLERDMQDLCNRVDNFSEYGRSPHSEERYEQLQLLENWVLLRHRLEELTVLKVAIVSNLQYV